MKNIINIGIPSKGRLRKDVLNIFKKEKIKTQSDVIKFAKNLIGFNQEMKDKNKELRQYLFSTFYSHVSVYRMNKKGQLMINSLFTVFNEDYRLMPISFQKRFKNAEIKERVVADYIAGMTDTFAKKEYESLFA
mgnify:CR=1 FL=1